jgi:hypothetical protein
MPLQVIGAGLGRTGTMTLKLALERLGFGPCHHMVEILADPAQLPFWNRAADGETMDWEEVYKDYRSTVDWPGASFAVELADHYPEAKVILSTRDPQSWYESMRDTIIKSMGVMGLTGPEVVQDHPMRFGQILIAHRAFGCDYSQATVIAALERHNAEVMRRIPAERLLVFEPSQGWEPLCRFLGVAIPDEPFPRSNLREDFWAHSEKAQEVSAREAGK